VSLLVFKSRTAKFTSPAKEGGRVPVKKLPLKSRYVSFVKVARKSRGPFRAFAFKFKCFKFTSDTSSVGFISQLVPRPLPLKSR